MKRNIFKSFLALMVIATIIVVQSCKDTSDSTLSIGTPTILKANFYPASGSGPVGTLVILSGNYYATSGSGNVVKFNGTPATIISADPGTITATVPAGATTGKITVTVGNYTGTSDFDFTVSAGQPAPYILDFSPKTGYGIDETEITITGVNFAPTVGGNTVEFNGNAATVTKASATSLTVNIAQGVTTGNITVDVTGGPSTATSKDKFNVPTPAISSFTPSASIVGSTVVIAGSNFSATAGNNVVMFNGVSATVVSVNDKGTSLTVLVPGGATSGKITVSVDGQAKDSSDPFTVN